jgi:hypothetical protein
VLFQKDIICSSVVPSLFSLAKVIRGLVWRAQASLIDGDTGYGGAGSLDDTIDNNRYSYCDVCAFNGYPNEKVVREYEGLRSEDEDGFIYKFTDCDYPIQTSNKVVHVHKWNQEIFDRLVNQSLANGEVLHQQ